MKASISMVHPCFSFVTEYLGDLISGHHYRVKSIEVQRKLQTWAIIQALK
jgi:hypothetical protein